ncbi:hypothetical protein ACLKA7_015681 [Drosophila subpalustris]
MAKASPYSNFQSENPESVSFGISQDVILTTNPDFVGQAEIQTTLPPMFAKLREASPADGENTENNAFKFYPWSAVMKFYTTNKPN